MLLIVGRHPEIADDEDMDEDRNEEQSPLPIRSSSGKGVNGI